MIREGWRKMRKFKDDIKFIDLFAGIGGFRFALESFGAKCVFSSEIDKFAKKTYEVNHGEMPSGDITKINSEDIPEHDILCGGFPCQPFSISGKQKGFEDSRGTMFFEIARIIKDHMPRVLFLENVANLAKHSDGETIAQMEEMLHELGYTVFHQTLNASDYGVPQSRKRLYIIGFRNDLNVEKFEFPSPTNEDIALEDILLDDHETDKYVINREDIVLKDVVVEHRLNKPIRIGTINKGGQGERIYSTKGHAITLSAEGGGPGAKTGVYLVNGRVRKLAPEECRRVQGFPNGFIIPVSDAQAWKQFGNSVAIPVLKNILKTLVEVEQLREMTKELE